MSFSAIGDESELECAMCLEVWTNPRELKPCEHIFCEACLKPLKKKECPQCNAKFTSTKVPNRVVLNMAANIQVKCDSCPWEGTRERSAQHVVCLPPAPAPVAAVADLKQELEATEHKKEGPKPTATAPSEAAPATAGGGGGGGPQQGFQQHQPQQRMPPPPPPQQQGGFWSQLQQRVPPPPPPFPGPQQGFQQHQPQQQMPPPFPLWWWSTLQQQQQQQYPQGPPLLLTPQGDAPTHWICGYCNYPYNFYRQCCCFRCHR